MPHRLTEIWSYGNSERQLAKFGNRSNGAPRRELVVWGWNRCGFPGRARRHQQLRNFAQASSPSELGPIGNVELGQESRHMELYNPNRNVELGRDFFVTEAPNHSVQDCFLLRTQSDP